MEATSTATKNSSRKHRATPVGAALSTAAGTAPQTTTDGITDKDRNDLVDLQNFIGEKLRANPSFARVVVGAQVGMLRASGYTVINPGEGPPGPGFERPTAEDLERCKDAMKNHERRDRVYQLAAGVAACHGTGVSIPGAVEYACALYDAIDAVCPRSDFPPLASIA